MEEVEFPRHWTSYVDDIDLPLLCGIRLFPTNEAIKILWTFGNRVWRDQRMREIKFRGKRADGKWVYGYLVKDDCEHLIGVDVDTMFDIIPKTVGQYTGLEDCTNVMRIYEGDVLDWTDVKGTTGRGVVKFKDGRFVVEFIDGSMSMSLCCFNDEAKVVGNIHDGVIEG